MDFIIYNSACYNSMYIFQDTSHDLDSGNVLFLSCICFPTFTVRHKEPKLLYSCEYVLLYTYTYIYLNVHYVYVYMSIFPFTLAMCC